MRELCETHVQQNGKSERLKQGKRHHHANHPTHTDRCLIREKEKYKNNHHILHSEVEGKIYQSQFMPIKKTLHTHIS